MQLKNGGSQIDDVQVHVSTYVAPILMKCLTPVLGSEVSDDV